jgi:hypothetical protein
MGYPQPPPFSPIVLLTLLLVVAASSVTFWLLVRRATSHRQWVAFSDWARDKGFRFRRTGPDAIAAPFDTLRPLPTIRLSLGRGPTSLLQIEAAGPTPAAALNSPRRILWNVLTRDLETAWPPTGLRPANATASVLDLFSLSGFPTLGATDRFVAYGTDSSAARVVSKSMLRSLLPPDVGLLLHGRHLVLDFSDRPFDAIEFGRMLALADQLAARLPAPTGG